MNRIIRNLIVAAPLSIVALTVAPAIAMVVEGPGSFTTPPIGPTPPTPPVGPGDLTTPPVGPTPPTGPDDFTAPTPCPTHGSCGEDTPGGDDDGYDVPTRIDAGVVSEGGDDVALSWVLAGGAIVLASGAAAGAARQRRTA